MSEQRSQDTLSEFGFLNSTFELLDQVGHAYLIIAYTVWCCCRPDVVSVFYPDLRVGGPRKHIPSGVRSALAAGRAVPLPLAAPAVQSEHFQLIPLRIWLLTLNYSSNSNDEPYRGVNCTR